MIVLFPPCVFVTICGRYIISQGVDVDATTLEGNSVVWIAANNGCVKVLNVLAGARVACDV